MVLLMTATMAFAQPTGDIPQEPGKCYAKCMIPDQYENVTEQLLIREASQTVSITPDAFETITEQVLNKEGSTSLSITPASFETITEQVLVSEGTPDMVSIPAKYETITEQVLAKEASTKLSVVPASFETITEQVLVKEAYSTLQVVPATYETITEQVLVKEASSQLKINPATYETITEQVLVREASSQLKVIPATFETITEQVLVKAAGSRIERKPAKYETVTMQVETSPAATKWVKKKADANCLSADPDDCLVWCLVEIPATSKLVTKQVRVGCEEGWTDNGDDCTRSVPVPAEYSTRTYQKLKTPATTEKVAVPAEYSTRTYQKLVNPVTTERIDVPAEYSTRTYQKLKTPARTEMVTVPAVYETRTYQKLVKDAYAETTEVPVQYSTRTYQKLVKDAYAEEVPCGNKTILENINFETASAVLTRASYAEIKKIENELKASPETRARLVGHTDSQGGDAYNQDLSERRAKAVYQALIDSGIDASRLSYEGKGESAPIASNETASGRLKNRRTEMVTFGGEAKADCNQYGTRTYQKLAQDASVSTSDVAAQFGTYQKLAKPASVQTSEVPAQYTTVTKRQLVKAGGFTEWREVVCSSDVTTDLVRSVQAALKAKGYNPGPVDNVMGAATKSALVQYQKDNGLPVGNLDFETLRSLGINQ